MVCPHLPPRPCLVQAKKWGVQKDSRITATDIGLVVWGAVLKVGRREGCLHMNLHAERGQPCPREPTRLTSRTRMSALLRQEGSLSQCAILEPWRLSLHDPCLRSRRCETAEIGAAGRIRQFTLAATRIHGPNARAQFWDSGLPMSPVRKKLRPLRVLRRRRGQVRPVLRMRRPQHSQAAPWPVRRHSRGRSSASLRRWR
jgi:hypothetical protein